MASVTSFSASGKKCRTVSRPVSSGNVAGVFAGALPVKNKRAALDPHGMHREFPDIWAEYLHKYYGGRRGRIIEEFGVDDRTARAWLSKLNKPSGPKVALAAARHPEFFAAIEAA
ncbi:hypothetical protein [Roseinatronobacter bogoriensis]|nr:hypothetical protein [Rhodobaca bogoriensis]MBB4207256.1 hypothetical protein [Rhodobaca bogoriensis DSM 18756]TDY65756.1 hypothetical protein EV660_11724 [Rhodobaca bogoriensis DSM 18756]